MSYVSEVVKEQSKAVKMDGVDGKIAKSREVKQRNNVSRGKTAATSGGSGESSCVDLVIYSGQYEDPNL